MSRLSSDAISGRTLQGNSRVNNNDWPVHHNLTWQLLIAERDDGKYVSYNLSMLLIQYIVNFAEHNSQSKSALNSTYFDWLH